MKSLYGQLNSFNLGTQGTVLNNLKKMKERDLTRFINGYLEYAKQKSVPVGTPGATDIFLDSHFTDNSLLPIKQLALWAHKIHVTDKLVEIALNWDHIDAFGSVAQRQDRSSRIDEYKELLADEIEKLLVIKPLVQAGIVHIAPVALASWQKEARGLYAEDFFSESGPLEDNTSIFVPEIQKYMEERVSVFPAKTSDDGLIVFKKDPLTPRNTISIEVEGDALRYPYFLSETFVDGTNSNKIRMFINTKNPLEFNLPDEMFWSWVKAKKKEVAQLRLEQLERDLKFAALSNARFITNSNVSNDLMKLGTDSDSQIVKSEVVKAVLKLQLPYSDRIKFRDLAKARKDEVAFDDFRQSFNKLLKEVAPSIDEPNFQELVNEAAYDIILSPIAKVERQLKRLGRGTYVSYGIGVGTLALNLVAPGSTLLVVASGLGVLKILEAYNVNKKDEDRMKDLPGYFYWQALGKSRD